MLATRIKFGSSALHAGLWPLQTPDKIRQHDLQAPYPTHQSAIDDNESIKYISLFFFILSCSLSI